MIVSRNTPIDCTNPCSTGWSCSEIAADIVMVPCPASFDSNPRLIPCANTVPKAPPKIASGLNAPMTTAWINAGNKWIFAINNPTMTVAYKTAITGTILSVTAVTLLIPPNTAIAIPMIRITANA